MKQLFGDILLVAGNNELNVQMVPTPPVGYTCPYTSWGCAAQFATYAEMVAHMRAAHPGLYSDPQKFYIITKNWPAGYSFAAWHVGTAIFWGKAPFGPADPPYPDGTIIEYSVPLYYIPTPAVSGREQGVVVTYIHGYAWVYWSEYIIEEEQTYIADYATRTLTKR